MLEHSLSSNYNKPELTKLSALEPCTESISVSQNTTIPHEYIYIYIYRERVREASETSQQKQSFAPNFALSHYLKLLSLEPQHLSAHHSNTDNVDLAFVACNKKIHQNKNLVVSQNRNLTNYDLLSLMLKTGSILALLLTSTVFNPLQAATTTCDMQNGCNLNPSGFKHQQLDPRKKGGRFTKSGTYSDGYIFSLKKGHDLHKSFINEFNNGELNLTGSIIFKGVKGNNESFILGYDNPDFGEFGVNIKYNINHAVISESAFMQQASTNNQGAEIYIKDFWIEDDSGIVTYYDKNTLNADNLIGQKLRVDNIYAPDHSIFHITLIESDITLDKNSPKDNNYDVSIGKIQSGKNTIVDLMGVHKNHSLVHPTFTTLLAYYNARPYYDAINPMAIDAKNSTYQFGTNLGIDENTRKWLEHPELATWKLNGEQHYKMYVKSRFTFDKGFNWANKNFDNDSKIFFYSTDFLENQTPANVAANTLEMVKPHFYGNNSFNGVKVDIYDGIFYRNDKNNQNTPLVNAGESQTITNLRDAEYNLHFSASLENNDPKNFQPLHFEKAKVTLVGDKDNNNIFNLNVTDMDFSLDNPDYVNEIADILSDSREHTLEGAIKVPIITADSVSIAEGTDLHINGRHVSDTDSRIFSYTTAGSHNVEYTITDAFGVSSANQDSSILSQFADRDGFTPKPFAECLQSLYYIDKTQLFTMVDESNLNVDPQGKDKFLAVPINTRGEGEKIINFNNSADTRGSVEVTVKVPEGVNIGISPNTTTKLGLNNALGDQHFKVNLRDADSIEKAAILDLNGYNFATNLATIELGNNSKIINSRPDAGNGGDFDKNGGAYLLGKSYKDEVLKLGKEKEAYLLTNVTVSHGAVNLAHDFDPDDTPPSKLSKLHVGSIDGSTPGKLTIQGSLAGDPDPNVQAHLFLGASTLHVHSGSSLVLGPEVGIHINYDDFDYDLDNNENQHVNGGHIVVDKGGTVVLQFNDNTGSHLSVDHIVDVNDHHFLISGNDDEINQNDPIANRIKIKINDKLYDSLGMMTDAELQDLEDRLDAMLRHDPHIDGQIHLQDFSFEIRRDGIFFNAKNIPNVVEDTLPDLEFDDIFNDYIDIESGQLDDVYDRDLLLFSQGLPIFKHVESLIEELLSKDNIQKYGRATLAEAIAKSMDFSTQLATVSKIQAMTQMGLDQSYLSLDSHLNQATIWPLEVEQNRNLWVDVFMSHQEINKGKTYNHDLRSEMDLKGIIIGYDDLLSDNWLLGGALGYNTAESKNLKDSSTPFNVTIEGEIENFLFMLYTAYQPYEHLLLKGDVILAKGQGSFDYTDAFGNNMLADVNLLSYRFDLKALMPFNLTDDTILSPYVAFNMTTIMTDDYQVYLKGEQYSDNKTDDITLMSMPLGLNLSTKFNYNEDTDFFITADASYIPYFGDTSFKNRSHFGGVFRDTISEGFLCDEDAISGRLDFRMVKGNFTADIFGAYLESESLENYTFGAKFNYAF